jgi:hypothetical protein
MPEQHFLSSAVPPATHSDVFGPLQGGERELWQGRCAVAEYAFDQAASLPRWALPETTEVLVTDHRVVYAYTRSDSPDDLEVTSGELRWLWPQHLRVQPGARTTGRAAAAAQIQLVCASSDGSFPALVFAGGDLATVADADRLANLMRHAIARFRVDNAEKLGLSTPQARMLSRLLIGPEFSNYQGGEGQTVTLLGALSVHRPAEPEPAYPELHAEPVDLLQDPQNESLLLDALHSAAPAAPPAPAHEEEPHPASVSGTRLRVPGYRPGLAADEARALQAAAAEEATQLTQPDLASRAAELAARVASLVSAAEEQAAEEQAAEEQAAEEQAAAEQTMGEQTADLSDDQPTTDLAAHAAKVRRAAARFAANSAKGKATVRRAEPEIGSTSRGNRSH